MLRVVRIFTRDEIRPRLLPTSKVVLNPDILFDLSFENGFRRFDAIAGQILDFGDHSKAYHIAMLWNVPKPSLFRHIRDSGCPFINARIAFSSFVIGPNGDFIEEGVADTPIISPSGKCLFTRTIQSNRSAIFNRLSVFSLATHTNDAIIFFDQLLYRHFLLNSCTL